MLREKLSKFHGKLTQVSEYLECKFVAICFVLFIYFIKSMTTKMHSFGLEFNAKENKGRCYRISLGKFHVINWHTVELTEDILDLGLLF